MEPGSSPLSPLDSAPSVSTAPSPTATRPATPAPAPAAGPAPALALVTPAPPKPLAFPLLSTASTAFPISAPSITPSTSLAPPPAAPPAPSPLKRRISFDKDEEGQDLFADENSAAYKAAKDASQWNGLLKWARKARGPQWDWGSGMYHVDIGSKEYYAGVTRLSDPSAVPSHLQASSHLPSATQYGTPTRDSSSAGGGGGTTAGTYDSGRPRRTRAAMGGRG